MPVFFQTHLRKSPAAIFFGGKKGTYFQMDRLKGQGQIGHGFRKSMESAVLKDHLRTLNLFVFNVLAIFRGGMPGRWTGPGQRFAKISCHVRQQSDKTMKTCRDTPGAKMESRMPAGIQAGSDPSGD